MLHFKSHTVDLTFAYTYHKVQGSTMPEVILVLNKSPGRAHIKLTSVYVGISRVAHTDDIRLWPINIDEDTDHLTKMSQDAALKIWKDNYSNHKWDTRALQKLNASKVELAMEKLADTADLNDLTRDELIAIGDERGLGVTSGQRGKKSNLILMLKATWEKARQAAKKSRHTKKKKKNDPKKKPTKKPTKNHNQNSKKKPKKKSS